MPSNSVLFICLPLFFVMLTSFAESFRNIRSISQGSTANGDDQDIQNLIAMLKRNGFTEESELKEALRVLRPEKFGRAETQQSRKKRQASAPQPDSESPATLVGPPLEAASQNLQPSPAKLNSKEDAPNFASEETTPISPASESKTENDREGPIEGVVNKFQATFSAAE